MGKPKIKILQELVDIHTSELADNAKLDINKSSDKIVNTIATEDGGNYSAGYYTYGHLNNISSVISSNLDPDLQGGWLSPLAPVNDESLPWVKVDLPFGVGIGDSIYEGHTALHSRLFPNDVVAYDPDYPNAPGQLSYELGLITGMYWFNHGIGGQETDNIWNRWRRDVLAETYDPGDGRGSNTLPRKPYVVHIHAGINDIIHGYLSADIQERMTLMAKSARDNGIICIFDNIGFYNSATSDMKAQIALMNTWMATTLPLYGAVVLDYYTFSKQPDAETVRTGFYADGVHLNKRGYASLARDFAKQLGGVPIFLKGLILESLLDPLELPQKYSRPKIVKVKLPLKTGQISGEELMFKSELLNNPRVFMPLSPQGFGYTAKIIINNWYLTGVIDNTYTGFSKIRVLMSETPSNSLFENKINTTSVGCKAHLLADVDNIAEETYTDIVFSTIDSDPDDMYNESTGRVTIPEDGIYTFNVAISPSPDPTTPYDGATVGPGCYNILFKLNNVVVLNEVVQALDNRSKATGGVGYTNLINIAKTLYCTKGNPFFVQIKHNLGAAAKMRINGGVNFTETTLAVYKVS